MRLSHEFFFHIDKDESKKFIYYLSVKEYHVWSEGKTFSTYQKNQNNDKITTKYLKDNFNIKYEVMRLGNFHRSSSNYSQNRQNITVKSYRVYPEKFVLKTSWYKKEGKESTTDPSTTTRFCAFHPFKDDSDPLYTTGSMFYLATIKYPYRVGNVKHKAKKERRDNATMASHWLEVATELGTVNRKTNINRNETKPIYKTLKLESKDGPANEILKEFILMDLDSLSKYFSGDRNKNFREMNIPNCLRHVYTLLDAYYKNNKKYLTMFRIVNAFMKPLSKSEQVLKNELQNLLKQLRKQKFPITIKYNPTDGVKTTCEASAIIKELYEKDKAKIEDEEKIAEIQNFLDENKSLETNADVMVKECPTFSLKGTKYPYTLKNLKKKNPNKKRKRESNGESNEESNNDMMMKFQYLTVESDEEMDEEVLYMSDLGYVSYSSESD